MFLTNTGITSRSIKLDSVTQVVVSNTFADSAEVKMVAPNAELSFQVPPHVTLTAVHATMSKVLEHNRGAGIMSTVSFVEVLLKDYPRPQ